MATTEKQKAATAALKEATNAQAAHAKAHSKAIATGEKQSTKLAAALTKAQAAHDKAHAA